MTDFAKLNNIVFELNSLADQLSKRVFSEKFTENKEIIEYFTAHIVDAVYNLNETPIVANSFIKVGFKPLNEREQTLK